MGFLHVIILGAFASERCFFKRGFFASLFIHCALLCHISFFETDSFRNFAVTFSINIFRLDEHLAMKINKNRGPDLWYCARCKHTSIYSALSYHLLLPKDIKIPNQLSVYMLRYRHCSLPNVFSPKVKWITRLAPQEIIIIHKTWVYFFPSFSNQTK